MEQPPPAIVSPRVLGLALASLAVLQATTVLRVAPPAAVAASAPADAFSAERAFATLGRVLDEQGPHPVGTEANARVRERLLAELRTLGLAPEVHEAWVWSPAGRGALVKNVLARVPGGAPGQQGVLLLCHYDSVPAGPGASDDGMGVAAVLEVVRALQAGPPLPRPVLVLVTDAEEVGLLGARAFVREHPWAREVGAVVNLEARGTSGPSFMFETSRGNAWLVRALAEHLPRPLCSSLFPAVYEALPNDTDLTVFLEAEDPAPALNFGCIGDVDRYHTPLDDLAHLSLDTLQHHGDNGLAVTRALAQAPLEALRRADERLVYFDVFGWFVVRWPEPWSVPLAALALTLVAAAAVGLVMRGQARPAALGWGLAAWLIALAAPLVLAHGLTALLAALAGSPSPWAASPLAGHVGAWALAGVASGVTGALLLRRAGPWGAWVGVWAGWALLGIVVAARLPGACFAFVAPALVAGLLGVVAAWGPARLAPAAWLVPLLAAACLWLPMARGFEAALGLRLKLPVVAAVALLAGALLPVLPAIGRGRLALGAGSAVVGLASLVVIVASGAHSAERPQRVNLVFEEDVDARVARWTIDTFFGDAPRAMVEQGGLAPTSDGGRVEGPAPAQGLAPPELAVLEDVTHDGARRVRCRVRSPRGAWVASLRLATSITAITVAGQRLAPANGLAGVDLVALPADGLELLLEVPAGAPPVDYTLRDGSFGVPAAGAALLAARPAWAVQSQQGDLTTVSRRGRL
jgi:hypothetical protein